MYCLPFRNIYLESYLYIYYLCILYTTLHCTTLPCTTLHCTTLHYPVLHYSTLHYTAIHCTTLHYTALHYTTLYYTTLHYPALHQGNQSCKNTSISFRYNYKGPVLCKYLKCYCGKSQTKQFGLPHLNYVCMLTEYSIFHLYMYQV